MINLSPKKSKDPEMDEKLKILYLAPGSGGGFYCQNCIRDLELIKGLRQRGHDAMVVPLYLPPMNEAENLSPGVPVFYGAIGLYLEERFRQLRRLPRVCQRWLNAPPLLKWAAGRAGSTRVRGLESMTLSVLQGENGRQVRQLHHLISWLHQESPPPDRIHLSNALLLGLAGPLRQALKVPLICSLQDEHAWIEAMPEDWADKIWTVMREKARDVDLFVAASDFYRKKMQARLDLPDERVQVVYPGMTATNAAPAQRPQTPVIGFLSRLSPLLGLEILVEAFLLLRRRNGMENTQLHLCGGMTADDRSEFARLRRRWTRAGAQNAVRVFTNFNAPERRNFLRRLSLLSVPVPNGEAFGLYLLEAMREGVPVVQPECGAFPEIITATNGGVLYSPNNPNQLADALTALLTNPDRLADLSEAAQTGFQQTFTTEIMTDAMVKCYSEPNERRANAKRRTGRT